MSETNKQTLDTYSTHLEAYIAGTPKELNEGERTWVDIAIGQTLEGTVLEIGSGLGIHADYLEKRGLSVDRTDGAEVFVDYQNDNGKTARILNVITDDISGQYDMVFAHAVFLHFTPEEFDVVLGKIHEVIEDDGLLVFSVKRGSGNEWSNIKIDAPRFFQYWEFEPLKEILESNGFVIDWHTDEVEDRRGIDWLYVIAKPI